MILLRRKGIIGDEIDDLNGLIERSPGAAVLMLIFLLSLAGIPPTAGFVAKLLIFWALIETHHTVLAVLGVLYILPAVYYYFRMVAAMWVRESSDTVRPVITWAQKFALGAMVDRDARRRNVSRSSFCVWRPILYLRPLANDGRPVTGNGNVLRKSSSSQTTPQWRHASRDGHGAARHFDFRHRDRWGARAICSIVGCTLRRLFTLILGFLGFGAVGCDSPPSRAENDGRTAPMAVG